MEELISIIVPVYNVADYLERCVESIVAQTYHNLEIILVDDGSTDGSEQICNVWGSRDSRIKVLHKKNGGAADAKNKGTESSTGEWIVYVDSDDWIHPQMIEILMNTVKRAKVELALCNFESFSDYKKFDKLYTESVVYEMLETRSALKNMYTHDAFITPWAILLKRTLALQFPYPKGRIHEDDATTYKYFASVKRIAWIDLPLYAYFMREDSVMGQKFSLQKIDCLIAIRERIDFFAQRQDNEMINLAMRRYVKLALWVIHNLKKLPNGGKYAKREKKIFRSYVRKYKKIAELNFSEFQYLYKFLDLPCTYYAKKMLKIGGNQKK